MQQSERYQVVVIGGGQAGLSAGYYLAKKGIRFVILDSGRRIGDSWRMRWDSLRLFSPARYNGLPGLRFPAGATVNPTKDEMADYLEAYAARFGLPVRSNVGVTRLSKQGNHFVVEAERQRFEADQVVVATGNFQRPKVPGFASELDRDIVQLHSSTYRNLAQLAKGRVLVVGAGNSGAEIAIETARKHRTLLSGNPVAEVPFRPDSFLGRHVLIHLMRAFGHHVLTVDTPLGNKLRPTLLLRATPLIRTRSENLAKAGVERVARVSGTEEGLPKLEDGQVLDVQNVIWCTGFDPGFSWIDLPIFATDGAPIHEKGIVLLEAGLYFVGLRFQYSATSEVINGVGRDAKRVVDAIAERLVAAQKRKEDRLTFSAA
jgi:putative flavoprotein involved in K+ transport